MTKRASTIKKLKWELEQGGMVVASGEGPRDYALSDASHYAMMYRQDGSVCLYEVHKNGKRELLLAATGSPK